MGLTRILYRLCAAFITLIFAAMLVYALVEASHALYSYISFCSKNPTKPAYIHRFNNRAFLMLTCHGNEIMNFDVEKRPQGKRL